jgi:aspartate carbamoyltransferase catalytic subunit
MTTMADVAHGRHLLGLDGLEQSTIAALLDRAEELRPVATGDSPPLTTLAHTVIANVFFENSTRTRCSFTLAARRLGAEVIDIAGDASSAKKGESLLDTCRNLHAMGCSAFVIRTSAAGGPHAVAARLGAPVINGGDGRHEHPTQGLLDLMTLRRRLGDLEDRTVLIVGDIVNSRVARSGMFGLVTMGAGVILCGPPRLVPQGFEAIHPNIRVTSELDAALPHADAVTMLRVQFEREAGAAIASVDEYRRRFGLDQRRLDLLRPEAPLLHPGPINRGLELPDSIADHPQRSAILEQVTNGVAVRMAVIEHICGEGC